MYLYVPENGNGKSLLGAVFLQRCKILFCSIAQLMHNDRHVAPAGKPWGWPTWDTVLMVAHLFRAGELRLLYKGDLLDFKKAIEPLTKTRYWQNIVVQTQPSVSDEDRKKAMELVKDCFHEIPPADAEDLATFITTCVAARQETMQAWQNEATYANYGFIPSEIND